MTALMRAARMHEPGGRLVVDEVEIPSVRPDEVLVRIAACGVIPNMNRVFSGAHWQRLPQMPAILGLDAAGTVEQVGERVVDVTAGDRVYINPLLSCGTCHYCRSDQKHYCRYSAFRGYFAFHPEGAELLRRHPYGGFAEYTVTPARYLVKLPPEVTFEQGARFGYLGTAYAALKRGGATGASWILINGVTGTLGVGAVLWALSLGVTRILGLGRNREVLDQVKQLSPARIETLAIGDAEIEPWARSRTEGLGVDLVVDCTGRGSTPDTTIAAMAALKPGGTTVTVGALTEPLPIDPLAFMNNAYGYKGSIWFTEAHGQQMAELARVKAADLGVLIPQRYPLEAVNDALEGVRARPGGFTNIVIAME
jgi:alcohol dehydrogenase